MNTDEENDYDRWLPMPVCFGFLILTILKGYDNHWAIMLRSLQIGKSGLHGNNKWLTIIIFRQNTWQCTRLIYQGIP